MKKINICFHINNISNCGGTEKVTTQISSLLLKYYDYYHVTILSSYYDSNIGPFFKENSRINYDGLFNQEVNLKKNYFKMIKKLRNYVITHQIDILIGVDTILSLFDIPALKGTTCKYIAWEHFNYHYNLGVKLRDYGRKLAVKKADSLVVLTDKDLHYVKENLNVKTNLVKIYNPFMSDNHDTVYDKESNIIMSSGRLTYQKGFDMLLEVAKMLKEKTSDFKWIILGEGEDRALLENKIKEYGLENLVELKGKVNNVEDYYKKSRMFVLTSRFEGLGIVILEAKSFHLPVISFDCDCGPSEMIKDGVNGYLIDDFQLEKMSDKIDKLLKDKEKCIAFSKNAKMDMDKFYPDTIIKKWDKLFKDVLK